MVCFLDPFVAVGVFPWSLLGSWCVSLVPSQQLVCFLGPFLAVGVSRRFLRSMMVCFLDPFFAVGVLPWSLLRSWCVSLVPSLQFLVCILGPFVAVGVFP